MSEDMDLAYERRACSLVQERHSLHEKQKIQCSMKGERKRAMGIKRNEMIFSIYADAV